MGLSDYMVSLFLFFKCTSRKVLIITVTKKIVPAPQVSFSFNLLAFLVCKFFESNVFDFFMVIYHCVILTFPCLILEVMSFRSQQVFRILSTDEQKVLWLLFWGVATGWQDFLMPKAVSKLSLWNQESLMAEKV